MEKNYKIESMVELRAFSITKALECLREWNKEELYEASNIIAEYVKGSAELPVVALSPDGVMYDYITKMIEENKKTEKKESMNYETTI